MTRRLRALAALVAVLLGLGFAALQLAGSNPSQGRAWHPELQALAAKLERPRTVVMVIFDELPLTSLMGPDGRIDAERYPGFGRLARRSVWYRGATAVHDSTALAVPAILDGRYPRRGLRSDASSHPLNLFTLLAPDYELHVSEEATGLCPRRLCRPEAGTTLSHLAHGRVERFRRFERSVRPRPRPALWFKHVLLPHVPWQLFPSGRSYRRRAPEPIPGLNGYQIVRSCAFAGTSFLALRTWVRGSEARERFSPIFWRLFWRLREGPDDPRCSRRRPPRLR